MASVDDVSLVVVLLDVNPYFWGRKSMDPSSTTTTTSLTFSLFLQHVLAFMNSLLLLNHLNQLVVIATGAHSCGFIYNSSIMPAAATDTLDNGRPPSKKGSHGLASSHIMRQLEQFLLNEESMCNQVAKEDAKDFPSLLSGSLSIALCYIQRSLKAGPPQRQPRIFCLQGTPDAPQQYVAIMNAIFSAQHLLVPIDACIVGGQHSAFLQQAAHITGGIYIKPPQLEGLFEYLVVVFATDLHSRKFLQLPHLVGVDFRASCFCHKKTIDMGYICSVCLSIFCKHHKSCATCGANFNQSKPGKMVSGEKRKVAGT